ncbi:MAG TPA: glycosyltransferase family 2 protein [Mycobacteriales bacterium]|nr:glycosyltransferase family 2 protein [Mycobacteriales bacterium]
MSALPAPPRVTVVVVTWQNRDLLPACLDSLAAQTLPHEVIVVDNASTDGTAQWLAEQHPEVRTVRLPTNTGFAGGVQAGLDQVRTPYAALLNTDACAEPDWLAVLVAELDADDALGAVTPRLVLSPSGALNNAGVALRPDGYGYDIGLGAADGFTDNAAVFGFSGAAAALRMSTVESIGGFPREFFLYYEDTDTSWRMQLAGSRIRYVPGAVVHHLHSASTDQKSRLFAFHNERNRLLMLTRCAPAGFAARQVLRFPLTTASLAAKRRLRRPLPAGWQFETGLRLQVLASYLRLLPWALRERRRIGRAARVPRADVAQGWLGR